MGHNGGTRHGNWQVGGGPAVGHNGYGWDPPRMGPATDGTRHGNWQVGGETGR